MTSTTSNHASRRTDGVLTLAVMTLSFMVYKLTLTPSLSFLSPDGNELATIPYLLGLAHPTGYPLYTWLGKMFTYLPFGDVAHRMNIMSATLGAFSIGLTYSIMRLLTGREDVPLWISRLSSAFTALLFAFSRAFWSQTGIAEVYAPNMFMLTLTVWLLLKWAHAHETDSPKRTKWLAAFALSYGLSLGTHMSNLGFAPAFAIFILLVDHRFLLRWRSLLLAAGCFLVGVLQFIWLPLAGVLGRFTSTMHPAPATLAQVYTYTLGAFDQLKFAFPLAAMPARILIYLALLRQQVFMPGILLGVLGMSLLLFHKPRRFFLFVLMYGVHLVFFLQYQVFDLDVFYIPAHLIYIVFIGFAVFDLSRILFQWASRRQGITRSVIRGIALIVLAAATLTPLLIELRANWEANDRSGDTAINDFYDMVWSTLPENAALLGKTGVMGFDMLYYPLVYDIRPDVTFLNLENSDASHDLYTTLRPGDRTGFGQQQSLFNREQQELWYIPVLVGRSDGMLGRDRALILYHAVEDPPELFQPGANPDVEIEQPVGPILLAGVDIPEQTVNAGDTLVIRLYWDLGQRTFNLPSGMFNLYLDELRLESHQLGLGNLERYLQERNPVQGLLVEELTIVIPTTVEPGQHTLSITIGSPLTRFADESEPLSLGSITLLQAH